MTGKEDNDPLEVAFTAAQGEMKDAVFNRVNPHFKSKYADRSALGKATKPALTANGLNIRHRLGLVEGLGYCVITRLSHTSGKFEESAWPITGTTPQQRGSEITYGCRYNVASLCNIASEEDDDANEAEQPVVEKKSAYQARKDDDYSVMAEAADACTTKAELETAWKTHRPRYDSMPDGWQKHIREHFSRVKASLAE